MIKNWVVKYFLGGYLATSFRMSKRNAYTLMMNCTDGHCIEKASGFFKGKRIYKHEKENIWITLQNI